MSTALIKRKCDLGFFCNPPHGWERLNPVTGEPYRRGRVAFFCPWRRRT